MALSSHQSSVTANYLKICSDLGCRPIPELLTSLNSNLKKLSIASDDLQDSQIISMCAILPLSSCEELTLQYLDLPVNSWVAISDACYKTRTLSKLTFKQCKIRSGQSVKNFGRALGMTNLHCLEVFDFKFGDEFVYELAEGNLLKNEKLNTLRLCGCNISDDGACVIAKTLEYVGMMSCIKTLELSNNKIGDTGAHALASMLCNDTSSSVPLLNLEVDNNMISDNGGIALCQAAKGALVLQRLNLNHNHVGDATISAIADAVRFNTGTLKELAIAGSLAKEEAAVQLLRAATRSNTLQLLDLRGLPLGHDGIAHLVVFLKNTSALHTIMFDVASKDSAEALARESRGFRSLMQLTVGGPIPQGLLSQMGEVIGANTVRIFNNHTDQNVRAWVEDSAKVYQMPVIEKPPPPSPPLSATVSMNGNGIVQNGLMTPPPINTSASARSPGDFSVPLTPSFTPTALSAPTTPRTSVKGNEGSFVPPRSPRSEAAESTISRFTQRTGRTNRTNRTSTSFLSFNMSDVSRRTYTIGDQQLRMSASLAAGGAALKAAVIFRKNDENQDNHLNKQELLQALEEMGVLQGIKARHIGRFVDAEFKKADWDQDGKVSLQDFITYYDRIAHYQTHLAREGRIKSMSNLNKQMIPPGVENHPHLKKVFKNYCKLALGQGRIYADVVPRMNAQQFHRFCQDAGFVEPDGRLSSTTLDVIFYRYRISLCRRLGLKEFIEALSALAYEMGMQFEDVMEVIGCGSTNNLQSAGSSSQKERSARDGLGPDISFDVMVPLPTVVEGSETATKGKKKKSTKGKPNKTLTNPLFDTSAVNAPAGSGAEGSGAGVSTATSSFAVHPSQSRFVADNVPATGPPLVSAAELEALETRIKVDLDARLLDASAERNATLNKIKQDLSAFVNQNELQASSLVLSQAKLSGDVKSLQEQLDHVVKEIADLKESGRLANFGGDVSPEVAALPSHVEALEVTISKVGQSVVDASKRLGDLQAQVQNVGAETFAAFEKKLLERQGRYEGALMQVAKQVDALDHRMREEQESNLKLVEQLMSSLPQRKSQ